jgi:hypothetical protein
VSRSRARAIALARRPLVDPSAGEPGIRAVVSDEKSLEIEEADARTRTAAPFITRDAAVRVRDAAVRVVCSDLAQPSRILVSRVTGDDHILRSRVTLVRPQDRPDQQGPDPERMEAAGIEPAQGSCRSHSIGRRCPHDPRFGGSDVQACLSAISPGPVVGWEFDSCHGRFISPRAGRAACRAGGSPGSCRRAGT